MNKADFHRQKIEQVVSTHTYVHQRLAAEKVHLQFAQGHRAVILTAEMQSGKSGIALALACKQRLSLDDQSICERAQLKDTLFLVTMADVALQEQASEDLSGCPNVVVSNLVHFRTALLQHFKGNPPKLLIIDECHYGSASDAVRYAKLFDYIENEARETRIVLISATPFSALFAAGSESILRASFNTSLVFHRTPNEYRGIRQMHKDQQIIELVEEQRDFTEKTIPRNLFIQKLKTHEGAGWALIRVGNNNAKRAKEALIAEGFPPEQIFIVGQKLTGVAEHELVSLNEFKHQYQNAVLFDDKIIAITVASFRAGINFGKEMKEGLIASWDSTISNIAAVVQANIGRASGYHSNKSAKHFTNLKATAAYTEFLNQLEEIDTTSDFKPILKLFENICERYQVNGFDRGMTVLSQKQHQAISPLTQIANEFGYYECFDGSLLDLYNEPSNPAYPFLSTALEVIHQYNKSKPGISVRSEADITDKPDWLSIRFIDGQSFDNPNESCAKQQILNAIDSISKDKTCSASALLCAESIMVIAYVFDCNNLCPDRDVFTRRIPSEDLYEFSTRLGFTTTDYLIVLFHRDLSKETGSSSEFRYSRLKSNSIFDD